ncbi:hypothetical protein CSW58_10115 [Caulobacter sp. B11]|uniref:CgeB family protein n=1 Tax=Caulobacter sp. B11 TaxID=2048899 RepID=UPI000C12A29B|nr:glycosyltransferase [Caulobacter sp. B11]PHY12807.1 hypothetical protein CSW58_10115 [Caulobacter sp. B11]
MKIFYIGHVSPSATTRHRADALVRIGHQVTLFDPHQALADKLNGPVASRLHYRTGYRLLQHAALRLLQSQATAIRSHDAVWVDSGELFGPDCVKLLTSYCPRTVLFSPDDPTGGRDGRRFDSLVAALPAYDLCVTMRDPTLADFKRLGARRTIKVWRSYDEVQHRPPSNDEMVTWPHGGGIAFIGTWMRHENREDIILALLQHGISVSVWGDGWSKSRHWPALRHAWKGAALYGRDYCRAIAGADACLGFLSAQNRELHTKRSFEIPYIGGLLVAERTSEHLQVYDEDRHAIFWADAEECVNKCLVVLADPARSHAIRAAGMKRVRELGFGNEALVGTILTELFRPSDQRIVA